MKSFIKQRARDFGFVVERAHAPAIYDKLYRELYAPESLERRAFYNFGAGNWRHPFWSNVDYDSAYYGYPSHLIDVHWDIASGAPVEIESGTAELAYSSHTVEHLGDSHVAHLMREMHRVLKPGGVARITTPNIELYYQAYRRRDVSFAYQYGPLVAPEGGASIGIAADNMAIWLVHEVASQLVCAGPAGEPARYSDPREVDAIFDRLPMEEAFDLLCGSVDFEIQRSRTGDHVNWWTHDKITRALKSAGFKQVVVTGRGQSVSPVMRDTDHFDVRVPGLSLYVDAIK